MLLSFTPPQREALLGHDDCRFPHSNTIQKTHIMAKCTINRTKQSIPQQFMFHSLIRRCVSVGVASGTLTTLTFSDKSPEFNYDRINKSDIEIISGTASRVLSEKIAKLVGKPLCDCETTRFSDGEILVKINETMRSKDVFIIQTCGAPVNDNVIELLLSIAAAKRSGANTVTAVIPYFGYKLNRRALPNSTTHHSTFLGNTANDLAKMLHICGVDKVIAVDLQRPGEWSCHL